MLHTKPSVVPAYFPFRSFMVRILSKCREFFILFTFILSAGFFRYRLKNYIISKHAKVLDSFHINHIDS